MPKLDFENTVKISREVYKLFGKEQEFDTILERLISSYSIDNGSLNVDDDNCITKAHESRVLLSGTYYDVVLLSHEIGHKLRYDNSFSSYDIGYILGIYTNNSDNKKEILNTLLKYKDKGVNSPFIIDDEIIEYALETKRYTK